MPPERHPADALVDELAGLYDRGAQRIEALITAGLRRGLDPSRANTVEARRGDATLAYRARQRTTVLGILEELRADTRRLGPTLIARAHLAGALAVDRTIGPGAAIAGRFGGVHFAAVETVARSMTSALDAAITTAGLNVAAVFERADALAGGLSPAGVAGLPFIGRRIDDPYRSAALETIGQGLVALDTRRQISAGLIDRLVREGTTDALTGFIDRAERRWPLPTYAKMVARTTTREAVSRGTVTRLQEGGRDLVTISSHRHKADVCSPFDGRTFSLSGSDDRYPQLGTLPPFHPNCLHVVTPALADIDDWTIELAHLLDADDLQQLAPPEPAGPPPPPRAPARRTPARTPRSPAQAPTASPGAPSGPLPPSVRALDGRELGPGLGDKPRPHISAGTAARLEEQRITRLIAGDPGRDDDVDGAWWAQLQADDQALVKAAARDRRRANKALNETLGPELAHDIDLAWGKRENVRERLLAGELTPDAARDMAIDEWDRREHRRLEREVEKTLRALKPTQRFSCFSCGRYKARPSAVCAACGDDPVPIRTDPNEFDRAYGYDAADAKQRSDGIYEDDPFGDGTLIVGGRR